MEQKNTKNRVRFAPSPTGWMHLGSVRAALFNKLYAVKNNGSFILRIEDTDASRNVDPGAKKIQEDLAWLGLSFDEGPYFQSERNELYQKYLEYLIQNNLVYRCFDTPEELGRRRQLQLARGIPPKYDRACLALNEQEITEKLKNNAPFIWRLKMPAITIHLHEATRGEMAFDLTHFSDFAVTRQDGSCTFLFANFVDDVEMGITMVIRGEDHLSNSASQAALYHACNKQLPTFFHLPLVCSADGKKLSKRDFGFSLSDLQNAGYLPQAINNYIALLGHSFPEEIMDLATLAQVIPFNEQSPKNSVRYDSQKLRWINHAWIQRLSIKELTERVVPFLTAVFPNAPFEKSQLAQLLEIIRPNLETLTDAVELLGFVAKPPENIPAALLIEYQLKELTTLLKELAEAPTIDAFRQALKTLPQKDQKKNFFVLVRLALTAKPHGIGIQELTNMLPHDEMQRRIQVLYNTKL